MDKNAIKSLAESIRAKRNELDYETIKAISTILDEIPSKTATFIGNAAYALACSDDGSVEIQIVGARLDDKRGLVLTGKTTYDPADKEVLSWDEEDIIEDDSYTSVNWQSVLDSLAYADEVTQKTMAKFGVTCTMVFNGYVEVEAHNEEEAIAKAEEMLNEKYGDDFPGEGNFGKVHFSFGEATADFADKI